MSSFINSEFKFSTSHKITSDISKGALDKYLDGIERAIKMLGDWPIFLDTNILLGYYGMSQVGKENLISFIKAKKDRIYITKQIEQEFLSNRISAIKKDFFEPLTRIVTDFESLQNDVNRLFKKYKDEKKKILSNDYTALWDKFNSIESNVLNELMAPEYLEEMKEKIKLFNQSNRGIILKDVMLDLVSGFNITNDLDEHELSVIKSDYDKLLISYKQAKENIKWKVAFPGCGEKKDNPYGDFIIYHELLKHMKDKETSCVFLTNDVTKGDWLQNDKNPHIHYLENTYFFTRNVIFIVDGKQTLPTISFENIHQGPLEILNARYSATNSDKVFDVTFALRELIVDNKLTIKSSNDIAGDPEYGVLKELTINYRINDRDFTIIIPEGNTETIPQ
ncbi:PIN-like domain-containing protein [Chitinophaga sancti]|uniref:PIN-like domain-containing protein n=1 Tax=Chitinophaga sancti TaxID=1004 RepID=UPI003F7965CA